MWRKIKCIFGFHKWKSEYETIEGTRFKKIRVCAICGLTEFFSETYKRWNYISEDNLRTEKNLVRHLKREEKIQAELKAKQ